MLFPCILGCESLNRMLREKIMVLRDFGTALAVIAGERIEVSFPYDPQLIKTLKSLKGRWDPSRRCWSVNLRFARCDVDTVLSRIGQALLDEAPPQWPQALESLKALVCVTKPYELFAGEGGIRVALPAGHPGEYQLRAMKGVKHDRSRWYIPAKLCSQAEVRKLVERMVREDMARYGDWLEAAVGRRLVGDLLLEEERRARAGLVVGNPLYATAAFVRKVDEPFADTPLREFAFLLDRMEPLSDGRVRVRLSYPNSEHGHTLLCVHARAPDHQIALDAADVAGPWLAKSR